MIAMLLIYSISWCQNNDYFPTGENQLEVVIPINVIKNANAKLIERKYLLELNEQQDSIIILKDKYITEQSKIIKDFQNTIIEYNKLNENLQKELKKQKQQTIIISSIGGTIIVGCLTGIVINILK